MKKIARKLTLTCLALAVMSGAAFGQTIVPVYDLGTNVSGVHIPPTPGILDITNFSSGPDVALIDNPAIGNVGPEHINYYGDANNGGIGAGETFVTPSSYCLLQSVAFQMGSDNGNGGTGPGIFWLRIYQLTNANTAVLLAAYQCSNTFSFNANDWIQWTNLTVPLNPSSTYAYAFSRDPATPGWEQLWASAGNTYPNGQVCVITNGGGTVQFGTTGDYDANFDIGITNITTAVMTPPLITPTNTIFLGSSVTLSVTAGGPPPLAFQWQTDGASGTQTNIPGANTNVVTLIPSTAGLNHFQVVVTNSYGAVTSLVATVTVLSASAPILTTDISIYNTNVYAFSGGSVSFYANFGLGTLPITNQWLFSSTGTGYAPIVGGTNNTLAITNVQPAAAGYYKLSATNLVGSSNSSPVLLTALADPGAPANVGTNMYAYCVYTNNPWAYWKFEETQNTLTNSMQAYDYSGHNFDATYGNSDGSTGSGCLDGGENISLNGQYGPNPNDYLNGYPGMPGTNGCAGLGYTFNNGYLTVPPLNLNTNAVTFTMWIYPNDPLGVIAPNSGLLFNRNGADAAGVGFSGSQNANLTAALGYTWNNNNAATYGWNSHLFPIPQQWQFVAYVISPQNTTIYLYYVSGGKTNLLKAVSNITNAPEAFSGGTSWIGGDNGDNNRTFNGSIDEVAVFTNAMSEIQVQGLFLRALGLTNGVAPTWIVQPANTQVYRGQVLQIPALVGGIPSPNYQWQFQNGTAWANAINSTTTGIFGATNATFGWTNYSGAFTNFRCVAYNAFGTNTSTAAYAVVLPVPTNGQWTVNFSVTSINNLGTGLPYVGHGVLVGPSGTAPGTYWNALSGSQLTSTTSYRDDGATVSGISFGSTGFPGNFSSLGNYPVNNALLDSYAQITPTNVFVFHNVPNGRYNLALYGCDGGYVNRGITFIVNGVSQSVTNVQDVSFLPDNTVIYTNLLVTNGSLEVDMTAVTNPPAYSTGSTEGDFNGAQIQLVKYGPAILSLTNKNGNFVLTYVGGKLLEANDITGPWTTNTAVPSGAVTINPTGQMKFYRVLTNTAWE